MKIILITFLFLFSTRIKGQEIQYQLRDQYGSKLYVNLTIYDENKKLIESTLSDKSGHISINPKYFTPKYKFEIYRGICSSGKIDFSKYSFKGSNLLVVPFNDSCIKLNEKIQNIKAAVRGIHKSVMQPTKLKEHEFDSIVIQYQQNRRVIQLVNRFKLSGSKLEIDFYYNKNHLIYCVVKELNKFRDWEYKISEFFYENNEIIYEDYFFKIDLGITGDPTLDYNSKLDLKFLKFYIQELLKYLQQPITSR